MSDETSKLDPDQWIGRADPRQPSEAVGASDENASPSEKTVISAKPPIHTPAVQITPTELGKALVGRQLAHFQLTEFVGGGGMGAVFRATDTMLNRTVAVKVLSRDQGRDAETVKRFNNEAQSAARLDHENIARVYFVGEDDGWYFIVFEFIEGDNLRDRVDRNGPLSIEEALNITLQIAEALEHASQRDVVHRDIKPSNVLLTRTGRAKLVDMGLARLHPMRADDDDLTASGVTLGTFDYISPEQARDPRTADVRSDIYSLGCTLFFMLTAQPPFPEGTVLQKLLSHSSEEPPDPKLIRPDLPDELVLVVSKMLAKKPGDRFQRPSDLIGGLLVLAERLGLNAALHGEPIWISPEHRRFEFLERHLPWVTPLVILIAIVLFIEPMWLQGGSSVVQPTFNVPPETQRTPSSSSGDSAADPTPDAAEASVTGESENADANPLDERPLTPTNNSSDPLVTPDPARLDRSTSAAPREASGNSAMAINARTIIVDPTAKTSPDSERRQMRTLYEACRAATDDAAIDTIEIRDNGRIELDPLILSLYDRRLNIVAADGYAPILSFRAAINVGSNASEGMIQVSDGELRLRGLHFELVVPNDSLEGEWALFQLEKAQLIGMNNCTVTVRNSHGGRFSNLDDISVFHIVTDQFDDMLEPDGVGDRLLTEIDLKHCVIRGETTVLRADEATPMRFKWQNGLLVTSERFASIGGAADAPARGEQIMLDLQHVTAVMDKGLGDFTSSTDLPYLMDISILCSNSILVTQRWAPLLSQSGPQRLTSLMAQLEYFGNRNFYEGLETFWQLTPQDRSQSDALDFDLWCAHWTGEYSSQWRRVKWQNPPDRNRPVHEHRVVEYTLGLHNNPAIKSSQDNQDAGFQHGLLPRLPEPEKDAPRSSSPFSQF